MKWSAIVLGLLILVTACSRRNREDMQNNDLITLIILDPGHFHASLVQKEMYEGMDSTVYIYAPGGMELNDYLQRVESYNALSDDPTSWNLKVCTGPDFLERMLKEKPGNLVILAGNNRNKTEYIDACIKAGLNVLADKPMAIDTSDFNLLKEAFTRADEKGLLLYDIMTERFEITTILQKALSEQENIFGKIISGSPQEPAITKESVHHFFKYVSGKPLQRPAWFFDVLQEGEAIADVGTHLVDMVMWETNMEDLQNYEEDIEIISSKRWPTKLDSNQFKKVTGLDRFPEYLAPYVENDTLKAIANSTLDFSIKGVYARVSVEWAFEAPEGAGDTHYSIMRGTLSDLIIQQGLAENFRPELYIKIKDEAHAKIVESNLHLYLNSGLSNEYPGVSLERVSSGTWRINIPNQYRAGHEAHFAQLTRQFLEYLDEGKIPRLETDRMIAKYYITTKAVEPSK